MNQDSDKNIGVEIVKASVDDLMCIHDMAEVVFRHTYREILLPEIWNTAGHRAPIPHRQEL